MAQDPSEPTRPQPPTDDEPGEPLVLLATLREDAPGGFLDRLRAAIRRRLLVVELAELSWRGVGGTVLEYFRIVVQIFHRPGSREDDSR